MLVYDIEIVKAVPPRNADMLQGIEYCDGWDDKENMGVAVIGAYDGIKDRYRVFTEGNFDEFEALAAERFVCGFNSIAFDDVVCGHEGITVSTDYDLLQELWVAAGLGREFVYPTHTGFGLDAVSKVNKLTGKTGYGGYAPVHWQRGHYGKVIDYCLEDVRLTWTLLHRVYLGAPLIDPRDASAELRLAAIPKFDADGKPRAVN